MQTGEKPQCHLPASKLSKGGLARIASRASLVRSRSLSCARQGQQRERQRDREKRMRCQLDLGFMPTKERQIGNRRNVKS